MTSIDPLAYIARADAKSLLIQEAEKDARHPAHRDRRADRRGTRGHRGALVRRGSHDGPEGLRGAPRLAAGAARDRPGRPCRARRPGPPSDRRPQRRPPPRAVVASARCRCTSSSTGRRQRWPRPRCSSCCAEWARGGTTNGASPAWLTLEAAAAGGGLLVAWRYQDELRLVPLLALTAGYGLAIVLVHAGGRDTRRHGPEGVRRAGKPAARRRLSPFGVPGRRGAPVRGRRAARRVTTCARRTRMLMIPFQVLTVGAVWALRTEWSGWLAALLARVAREPALRAPSLRRGRRRAPGHGSRARAPRALGARGCGARRRAPRSSGRPRLRARVLLVWLLASGRVSRCRAPRRVVRRRLRGAQPAVLASGMPSDVVAAYTTQSTRGIIAESLPFLPLRLLGLAEVSPQRSHLGGGGCPFLGGRRRSRGPARAARGRRGRRGAGARRPRRGRRLRGPGPRRVPAHEPRLQPAVRARGPRRVGSRDRAARAVGARPARTWRGRDDRHLRERRGDPRLRRSVPALVGALLRRRAGRDGMAALVDRARGELERPVRATG